MKNVLPPLDALRFALRCIDNTEAAHLATDDVADEGLAQYLRRCIRAAEEGRDKSDTAFAACRSIRFAVNNASRYGGEYSLTDILAADVLAKEALGELPVVKPALKPLRVRSLKVCRV